MAVGGEAGGKGVGMGGGVGGGGGGAGGKVAGTVQWWRLGVGMGQSRAAVRGRPGRGTCHAERVWLVLGAGTKANSRAQPLDPRGRPILRDARPLPLSFGLCAAGLAWRAASILPFHRACTA